MRPRVKTAIALAVAVAGLAGGGYLARRTLRGRMHAIDAIPGNAFLVMTLDVDALRRSPLGAPVFGGVTSKLAGEKALTDLCGFDPLTRMSEIAVAVPEDGERGDFGIAIRADVSSEELLRCAKKVIEQRQGNATSAGSPTIRESGSYVLVEPESPDPDPLHRYPTLAYREGGPYLIGRGPWLSSMIDTAEGRLPSAAASSDHAALRKEVSSTLAKPSLLATAILPKAFRERLKTEMGAELGLDDEARGTAGRGASVMAGVLGVGSVGAGIEAGPAGGDSAVTAVFRCEEKTACAEVARLVSKRRLEWSQEISLRLLGLGPLLDSMKIDEQPSLLRVTSHAPTDEAVKWLDRLLTLRGARHALGDRAGDRAGPLMSAPGAPAKPAPTPDEVLKAPDRHP